MKPDIITRPMLAAPTTDADLDKLTYPLWVSPKLDGIRVICHPKYGGPVTRKLKEVPNRHIFECLSNPGFYGLDGELMCRRPDGSTASFNEIQSAVMSREGAPLWEFWVFDYVNTEEPFERRMEYLAEIVEGLNESRIKVLAQSPVSNPLDFVSVAHEFIANGYEGAVMRHPQGPYKQGRSTLKQQWLLKYKQFKDATGVIVGMEPLQHNENTVERDELGYAKRAHKKDGMRASTTMMGKLILDTEWGELAVGSGFDFALREDIWANPTQYIGRHIDFRYQTFGMLDKPRFPTFLRFRKEFD